MRHENIDGLVKIGVHSVLFVQSDDPFRGVHGHPGGGEHHRDQHFPSESLHDETSSFKDAC
jgi:hypothetical protein